MQLKSGLRLQSTTDATQVIVVKGTADLDLRCGGQPMVAVGGAVDKQPIDASHTSGTLMGKRYGNEDLGIELLCTTAGEGSLSVGDIPLLVKGAKPLPSSD